MPIQHAIHERLKKIPDQKNRKQLRIDAQAIADVVIRWWGDDAVRVLVRAARIAKAWSER